MKQRIIDTGQQQLVSFPDANIPYSTMGHSHDIKTTFNIGKLVPVLCKEVLPGDIVHIRSEILLRFQPMLAPVMHRANVRLEYFMVPNRIICSQIGDGNNLWEEVIGNPKEGFSPPEPPYNSVAFTPTYNTGITGANDLAVHLGLPLGKQINVDKVSMLPFGAYGRVIYDWYKDENFEGDEGFINPSDFSFRKLTAGSTDTANNSPGIYNLVDRNQDRDYFTSALPWPQKGPDVLIPVFSTNNPQPIGVINNLAQGEITETGGANITGTSVQIIPGANTSGIFSGASQPAQYDPNGSLGFFPQDIQTQAGSISDLATARAVQTFLTRDNFGSGRYAEVIHNQWGVTVPDYRLDRAMYLGSTIEPVQFSEVLQTSETGTTPQANMAGHGITAHSKPNHEHYMCNEHGWLMVIASVLPITSYQGGIDKMWTRRTRLDWPWPALANTGYQEILNKEMLWLNDGTTDDQVWGYQPRYQEYRTTFNQFQNDFTTSLYFWQMSQANATTRRNLNAAFLKCTAADSVQIFADTELTDTHLIAHIFHQLTIDRKLPKYGVPHF